MVAPVTLESTYPKARELHDSSSFVELHMAGTGGREPLLSAGAGVFPEESLHDVQDVAQLLFAQRPEADLRHSRKAT